jgi:L-threonylcarbamoyladenylate synthase
MTTAASEISKAARLLKDGGLVALPTETVYGLAADATNDRAVARIFEAKGRPSFNPLIVHVRDMTHAETFVDLPRLARKLADAFWPGPLTLVLPRKPDSAISHLVSAGLDTLAVRAPAHDLARAVLTESGLALAAPSANRSGTISPTTAAHVATSLGERVDSILDGGPCRVGVESTIVKIDDEALYLLRPGGIAREEIERVAGRPFTASINSKIEAPGMMTSHYAPGARLRLNVEAPDANEAYLGFGAHDRADHALNLSPAGDLVEAAANLFGYLRQLDALCADMKLVGIAVAPVAATGLGEAINDRLTRAAAPKTPKD